MKRVGMRHSIVGFTLIELLVVVAIIALLISILLPSLRKVREQAKESVCASYLAGFGRGFHAYASANRDYLCSGSFDPGTDPTPSSRPDTNNGRDGAVDKVGWVADLVNGRMGFPAVQLCPSNPAQYNQKLAAGSPSAGPYAEAQAREFIRRGYNSNYTQSWYMARTEARWPNQKNDVNWKRVWSTIGPLQTARMSRVAPARVPLLGDGGIEKADKLFGQPSVKSLTDGPYGGYPYNPQTYSDFGAAHGYGSTITIGDTVTTRDRANILFGDGHVGKFVDRYRDPTTGQRNGIFGMLEEGGTLRQEDLDAQVFDGVLSLGRRSLDRKKKV